MVVYVSFFLTRFAPHMVESKLVDIETIICNCSTKYWQTGKEIKLSRKKTIK